MADPTRYPDSGDNTGVEPHREPATGISRWQKVVGIVGLVLILLIVAMLLFGGDLIGGDGGGHTPAPGPPEGGH